MAKTTERERRATAREERRAAAAVENDPADALRTAASAAIAAAAVGAARALARRRHGDESEEPDLADEEELPVDDEPSAPHEPEPEPDPEQEPRGPIAAGDARRIVQRAREQLNELHGADAESVSSVRRTADGWRVGLEVVEMHRIPESTDVLATYEVELDDDGQLVTFERTARYYRSEADRR